MSKIEFFNKIRSFFLIGKRKKLLYIQIQPPTIQRKFRSFYITKNRLLLYCILGIFLALGFTYYYLGMSYFKYRYINKKYQKMTKIQKDIKEYRYENEHYCQQLKNIKKKAHHFSDFSEDYILNQELKPFLCSMSMDKEVNESENVDEINSYVLNLHNQMKEMFLFCSDEKYRMLFFTPSIVPISEDYIISSRYGFRRSPFNGKREFHQGMDFYCRFGTDIRATAYGEITYVRDHSVSSHLKREKFGRMVVIKHGESGFATYYAHCSKIYVKVGDWVERGHIIAAVGSSGRSTAPHLHYEVRRYSRPRNPEYYLPTTNKSTDKFASLPEKLYN